MSAAVTQIACPAWPTHKTLAMSKQGPFGRNRSYNCQNDESGHEVTAFTCIFGQIVAQIAGQNLLRHHRFDHADDGQQAAAAEAA
jgi:hypothetical protein